MTGSVLEGLRGSIAFVAGLLSSLRPVRCCDCRLERDEALVELARLRDELRIARWDADVPIRELREEIARLRDRLGPG